jgi:hypothetical protein
VAAKLGRSALEIRRFRADNVYGAIPMTLNDVLKLQDDLRDAQNEIERLTEALAAATQRSEPSSTNAEVTWASERRPGVVATHA